jgi:hypothetical protein
MGFKVLGGKSVARSTGASLLALGAVLVASSSGCSIANTAFEDVQSEALNISYEAEAVLIAKTLQMESALQKQPTSGKISREMIEEYPGDDFLLRVPEAVSGVITLDSGCVITLSKVTGGANKVTGCPQ